MAKGDKTDHGRVNSQSGQDELRSFVERAERIAADIKALKDDEKELFAEAKGRGYDTKILRSVIAERKRDPDDVAEEEAIRELYRAALGMTYSLMGGGDDDDDDGAMV